MAVFGAISTAIAAVSSWTVSLGALGSFAIGNFVLRAAVQLGVSALAKAFAGDGDQTDQFAIQGNVRTGGNVPRSFILGPGLTAGSLVWHTEWGEDGDTPNAFYTQVIALSDIPVAGLRRWFVNGQAVTLAGSAGDYGFAANEFTIDGKENAWVRFHDGNQTVADPFLTGVVSAGAPRTYSGNRIGAGIAYAVVTFRVNQQLFTGFPRSKFVLDGVPLYDVSKDSSAGGSGPQRWNDPATWGGDGDALPAVQAYNLARGISYRRAFSGGAATETGAISLDGNLSALSLTLVGGGGGDGSDGGATIVHLKDGATTVQTWTASGGLATSEARYNGPDDVAGEASRLSPFGDGADGQEQVFGGGSEGGIDPQPGVAGGTAGQYLAVSGFDISGLSNPSLEIEIGAPGPGAGHGFVDYTGNIAAGSIKSEWFYGLQGLTAARLPANHWIAQIEKCRAPIQGENGLEATYRCAGEVTVNSEIGSAFDAVLTSCSGRMSEVGGVFKLYVGAPDAPIAHLTDADIVSLAPQTFTPFYGLSNTVNGVIASYPSPDEGYVMRGTPPIYNAAFEVEDGGRRLLTEVALSFVPFPAQAQRLLEAELAAARRARRHTFTLPARFRKVEPGDVVTWDSSRNGYEGKQFRVDGVIDLPQCDLVVDLTEVDPSDHGNWQHDRDYKPVTPSGAAPVAPIAQPIAGWSVEPLTLYAPDEDGGLAAILVRWDGSKSDLAAVRVQARPLGSETFVFDGRIEDVSAGEGIVSQAIFGNTTYEVRGKYVPGTNRATEWSEWLSVTTDDVGFGSPAYREYLAREAQDRFDSFSTVYERAINELASFSIDNVSTALIEQARVDGEIKRVEDVFSTGLGDANAEITTIKETAVSDAAALAQLTQVVNASFGDVAASISAIETAAASDAQALAQLESSLNATLGSVAADIQAIQTANATDEQALAQLETGLNATIGAVAADVSTQQVALTDLDAAFSGFQQSAQSQIDGLNGFVSSSIYTKSETDSQISSAVNVVQSSVNGLSTTVSQVQTAQDGIKAQYGVRINSNGAVSGFGLLSGEGGSDFLVDADAIRFGKSNSQGGFKSAFQLIGSDLYLDNVFVRTLQIGENMVTVPEANTRTNVVVGNDAWQVVQIQSIFMAVPGALLMLWSGLHSYQPGAPSAYAHDVRFNINGTFYQARGGTAYNDYPTLLEVVKNFSGTVTVRVEWRAGNLLQLQNRTLSLIGVKR